MVDTYQTRKQITLDGGKYTIVYDASGSYPEKALRYGEEWRSLSGDNLIFNLCCELEHVARELERIKQERNSSKSKTCDGCKFKRCKRCDTCSRRYADRYEPYPPPKPLTKEEKAKVAALLSLPLALGAEFSRL